MNPQVPFLNRPWLRRCGCVVPPQEDPDFQNWTRSGTSCTTTRLLASPCSASASTSDPTSDEEALNDDAARRNIIAKVVRSEIGGVLPSFLSSLLPSFLPSFFPSFLLSFFLSSIRPSVLRPSFLGMTRSLPPLFHLMATRY
jgi:hypothetical protein